MQKDDGGVSMAGAQEGLLHIDNTIRSRLAAGLDKHRRSSALGHKRVRVEP
jgi:hypothetical protein